MDMTEQVEEAVEAYRLAAALPDGHPDRAAAIKTMDSKIAMLSINEMQQFTKAVGGSAH